MKESNEEAHKQEAARWARAVCLIGNLQNEKLFISKNLTTFRHVLMLQLQSSCMLVYLCGPHWHISTATELIAIKFSASIRCPKRLQSLLDQEVQTRTFLLWQEKTNRCTIFQKWLQCHFSSPSWSGDCVSPVFSSDSGPFAVCLSCLKNIYYHVK